MCGIWLRFHSSITHAVDGFYYRLGYWVANHTRVTLSISLVLVILCCFGFGNFTVESDSESPSVPSHRPICATPSSGPGGG